MIFKKSFNLSLFLLFMGVFSAVAQNRPIGYWTSFLPYNSAVGVATDGNTLYAVSEQAFYMFNSNSGQLDAYSKVEGMSDNGMKCIGYDMSTSTAILVYTNGNIDLFKDNTFYNIPELKIKTVAGSKNVSEVYTLNGYAYLSTDLGVIVIDIENQNIKETYEFNINNQIVPVKSFLAKEDSFYAVTNSGVFAADRNSNELQNFQIWSFVDSTKRYNGIATYDSQLFLYDDSTVYKLVGHTPVVVHNSSQSIEHIDGIDSGLVISEYDTSVYRGSLVVYRGDGLPLDSIYTDSKKSLQVTQTLSGELWMADEFGGLARKGDDNQFGYVTPAGPLNSNSFDIYAHDGSLWVAHGGFRDLYFPSGIRAGMFNYSDGKYKYFKEYDYQPFDGVIDVIVMLKDETNGTVYAGSYGNGLVIINPDGTTEHFNTNSIFDPSLQLGPKYRQVIGIAKDRNDNLWVSTMFSQHQLYVMTPEKEWYKYKLSSAEYGGPLLIDDDDRVWCINYSGIGGLTVVDPNGTVGDPSDDYWYHLKTGVNSGNLPSNIVNCLAKDRNGNIWVGTTNGIGIINNCYSPFDQTPRCDAEIPVVQYDDYAGYLFAANNVRAIAVDGANRKWVGTDDGVWLLSPDAGSIISRFTTDNSPLPSNRIQNIAVDDVTGEVYIGTEQGLVSYRGTATDGGTSNTNVVSFPNPVPAGYTGTIAIKGLVTDADVRITDISGQLVYRTKALGGQAIWNGLDYTGHKPQSGVYMIFASDKEGNETYTGKLVFLK